MKLRIGHINYKIKKVANLKDDDGGLLACVDSDNSSIIIDSKLNDEVFKKTLIHEITHAIFNESGFDFGKGVHTEDTVNRIGLTLHGFLKDNKKTLNKLFGE